MKPKKNTSIQIRNTTKQKIILTKNANGQTTLRIQQIQLKIQTIPCNRTRKYQNMVKMHNIELKQQTEEVKTSA